MVTTGPPAPTDAGTTSTAPGSLPPRHRRPQGRYRRSFPHLAVFVVASVAEVLRVPAGGWNRLWGEDGRYFVGDWAAGSSPSIFFRPMDAYQNFLPRVVSFVVVKGLPIHWWAAGVTVGSALLIAALSVLVFRLSADLINSTVARLGFAAIPVFCPIAGFEGVGDLNNIHYYLLYLFPWLLFGLPRSRWGVRGLAVVALVSVLTEPQLILYLPLVALMFVKRPVTRLIGLAWVVGVVAQLLSTAGHRQADLHNLKSGIAGYLANVVGSNLTPNGPALGSLIVSFGWWWLIAIAALAALLAVWLVHRSQGWLRLAVLTMTIGSPAAWCMAYYANDHRGVRLDLYTDAQLSALVASRWGTAAAMLLAAIVPLAVEVFARRHPRVEWVPVVVVVAMVAVMCAGFNRSDNIRNSGPPWTTAVDAARTVCARPGVTVAQIPVSPRGWQVAIGCDRLR